MSIKAMTNSDLTKEKRCFKCNCILIPSDHDFCDACITEDAYERGHRDIDADDVSVEQGAREIGDE